MQENQPEETAPRETIFIRVTPQVKQAVKERARRDDVSVQEFVTRAIKVALSDQRPEEPAHA